MKVLVINADCICVNSSANLCHLAYIRGLLDAGYEVTLINADGRDYQTDASMQVPEGVKLHTFYGVSLYEKLSLWKRKSASVHPDPVCTVPANANAGANISLKRKIKDFVLSCYGPHGIYATFLRKAGKFRSAEGYDYVLSISTPPASHLLAHNLIESGRVKTRKWIQIWEDPWYSDVYGYSSKAYIKKEEYRLLKLADHICYVSPLTLRNQQQLFPDAAHKMYWQPLPYYYKGDSTAETNFEHNVYGYFGDYTPEARNLQPFYEAAKETGIEVNICGNPSGLFQATENIRIYPRLQLHQLKPIEDNSNVLVFLCNRKGGQIPGKIYQYSATNKVILFIMDGTVEEQQVLVDYFGPLNRYVFCSNTQEDIIQAIRMIENGDFGDVHNVPLEVFNPQITIQNILECR